MDDFHRSAQLKKAWHCVRSHDTAQARLIADGLLQQRKKDVDALEVRAWVALHSGHPEEAADFAKRCVSLRPKDVRLRVFLGRVYGGMSRYREAVSQFERALKLDPSSHDAAAGLAAVFEERGEYKKCRAVLAPLVRNDQEHIEVACVQVRLDIRDGHLDEAIARAHRHLDAASALTTAHRDLWFAVAKAHEKAGNYDASFDACSKANHIQAVPFDPDDYARDIDSQIEVFSAEHMSRMPRSSAPDQLPVFIVGMPRSGSTLVDQILDAHPRVHSGGELPFMHHLVDAMPATIRSTLPFPHCSLDMDQRDADLLSGQYLQQLRSLNHRADRIVDKYLTSFRWIGLISVLFPGASIIHTHRDPLNTCLSCFMERMDPAALTFASDLRHLGLVYRQYERIMDHWRTIPGLEILDVEYESMVSDQERVSRQIVELCGLDWDDACLTFYKTGRAAGTLSYDQVRQPIYKTSVKRAEHFAPFLGPLRDALEETDT